MGSGSSKAAMGKAVWEAARAGNEAELTRLIGLGGNVNWRDWNGHTALLWASINGREGCVRLLLEAEAIEVNAKSNSDWTALHWAAYYGYLAIAKRLLEGGADPTLRNKGGKTAVDYARINGKSEVVALLSEPRDWKAEAAKAKADKAAAAKAAAAKAAADKAAADKAAADKAAAEELRRRATALGLLPVLTTANIADDAMLKKSIAFCDEHGVTSVSDMVEYNLVQDFVHHLGLKTVPGKKLLSMLQTSISGLAAQLSDRLFSPSSSRKSSPKWDKAAADKAAAEKAAADKAEADKAAAEKAEAEKAGAHSTESARVAAAKVVPAAEPAALSLLLNHWGAAARRCLSTCVGGATALPERRAVASSSAPPFFLASAPVSVLDRAKRLVESRGGEYAAGDKDDIFNSMTLGDQESWKVGWKGKVEMLINILKKHNPGQKVTALAIAGGPACDWERGELHNTFCSNHRELVLKQLGDMEDLEMWLDRYHPASTGNGYAA